MTRLNLAVKDGLLFIHFKKSMLHSFEDIFFCNKCGTKAFEQRQV